jgi:hypothetical protein
MASLTVSPRSKGQMPPTLGHMPPKVGFARFRSYNRGQTICALERREKPQTKLGNSPL